MYSKPLFLSKKKMSGKLHKHFILVVQFPGYLSIQWPSARVTAVAL